MSVSAVDRGPRRIAYTTEVPRPTDELFALVADPHRHGELDGSGTVRDTVKGPERVALGDRFSVKMKMYGVPYRITSRVTDFADGRVVEWRHPLGHRWRWEFEPTATGTRVTEVFDYSHIPAPQAKFLEVAGMTRQNSTGIRRTLEKLAR
ncbi:YD repeat-containing protein [Jatrophihabitans endophyticus]|uniref:YD repeat-containing protein n=1 Tax=Jatrophihabitans endophyticus TaxID=1206085 RepID=A0A1M5R2U3_9ACTN|nr:SRPBCC family protein [Jatrophihabitans endophyticus]SHH20458.1 YD repeat-containing protein [Jatrophihabitans endophyticus]